MSAQTVLEELQCLGVVLETEGDLLHVDGPAGVATEELRTKLGEHKLGLLELLQREQRKRDEAGRRGLVIKLAEDPDWIALHDPLTGEWHEVRAEACLPGIVKRASEHSNRKVQHKQRQLKEVK